ncbi:MAG: hypothetical protein ABSD56_08645 [Bryobacteraceae bacterium]
MRLPIPWPEGKQFAFTIFDDPDGQTLAAGQAVYSLLADLGFRTTKGVWPIRGDGTPSDRGETCATPAYREWVRGLQARGFEIGLHNATFHTSNREQTLRGLEQFRRDFGRDPKTLTQHFFCDENLYWGDRRVTGLNRLLYNLLTCGRNRGKFSGDIEGHSNFWGDLCQERIKYVRNFVFADIDTLRACPFMPYHDPARPYVNYWFASSEGAMPHSFVDRLSEASQRRLEEQGGACIMYTHFSHRYCPNGRLHPEFRRVMERLSRRPGWFVPVATLLDFLLSLKADATLAPAPRGRLERRWLLHKARFGAA